MKSTSINFLGVSTCGADCMADAGELAISIGCIAIDGQLIPLPSMPTDADTDYDDAATASAAALAASLSDYPEMPIIEFGLGRADYLAFNAKYTVPAAMAPAVSSSNGASKVHPTTTDDAGDFASAAKTVFQGFAQAVRLQADAKGCFHQPFFVRYALRLTDGQHILPSAPILMLPNALPPFLGIDSITETDNLSTITLSSSSYPYFKLRYRIHSLPDGKWASRIAAIDIFVTEPIPTYDNENISQVGSTYYSESGSALAGVWSDMNDYYQPHTVQSLGHEKARCWDVAANQSFMYQLACASRFYRIASIPYSQAAVSESFQNVNVACSGADAIKTMPELSEQNLTHCGFNPAFARYIGGRVHAGGGSITLPSPFSLKACMARATPLSDTSNILTIVKVWIQDHCQQYMAEGSCYIPYALGSCFPSYLFYPHRGAYMMQLTQNDESWTIPMYQHDSMDGAYWLNDSCSPPDSIECEESTDLGSEVPRRNVLYTSSIDNPLCFPIANIVGSGTLMDVAPALQSFSAGQWGQFPIYVFATDGIWALTSSSSGTLTVRQQVSTINAQCVCQVDDTVAYTSPQGIMLLSGSKITYLSKAIAAHMAQPELPHLAGLAGCQLPDTAFRPSECQLVYDSEHQLLWAVDGELAWVYSFASQQWGQALIGHEGMIVLTRPFQIDGELRVIELASPAPGGAKWVLYGSDDMLAWSIVASGRRSHSGILSGSPYRYYRLAISAPAQPLNGIRVKSN